MEIKACYNCNGVFGHAIKEGLCSTCYPEIKAQEAKDESYLQEIGCPSDGDDDE